MRNKQTRKVFDLDMAYVEMGSGDPIVFLHGNPTSSYLWRGVMPHVAPLGRCIAPDLIGMGDSAKLVDSGPGAYRYVQHRRYLDELFRLLDVRESVTLVGHDWGALLAFDWAVRHPDSVKGLVYMEAIVTPLNWDDWPSAARPVFQAMRTEAGDGIVLDKNIFVERILPASIQRDLTSDEMEEYSRPFRQVGEDRRPTLTWPREIPIDGSPARCPRYRGGLCRRRWLPGRYPSCSSTPIPVRFWWGAPAKCAGPGPARPRSLFPVSTSSRKTRPT